MHDTNDQAIDAAETLPALTGPAGPQPWVDPPPVGLSRRTLDAHTSARLWWVGVHGGAGESTLAALLPDSRAAGHAWPELPAPSNGWRVPVVLVARSNIAGLTAAEHAATEWAAGTLPSVELLGLVVLADAPGRLPRSLRDLTSLVAGGVPRCWQLPWVESWRTAATPPLRGRALLDLLTELQALTRYAGPKGVPVPTPPSVPRGHQPPRTPPHTPSSLSPTRSSDVEGVHL